MIVKVSSIADFVRRCNALVEFPENASLVSSSGGQIGGFIGGRKSKPKEWVFPMGNVTQTQKRSLKALQMR